MRTIFFALICASFVIAISGCFNKPGIFDKLEKFRAQISRLQDGKGCQLEIPDSVELVTWARFKYQECRLKIVSETGTTIWESTETGTRTPKLSFIGNRKDRVAIVKMFPEIKTDSGWIVPKFMAIDTMMPGFRLIRFRNVEKDFPEKKDMLKAGSL